MLNSVGPHWCALLDEYGLRGSWDDVSASRSWMVAAVRAGASRHQAVARFGVDVAYNGRRQRALDGLSDKLMMSTYDPGMRQVFRMSRCPGLLRSRSQ